MGSDSSEEDEKPRENEETLILSNNVNKKTVEDTYQNKVSKSQPSDDLRDAWMNDDVGIMNDSSDEDEEKIEKEEDLILQKSDNKKHEDDASKNKIFLTETIDID